MKLQGRDSERERNERDSVCVYVCVRVCVCEEKSQPDRNKQQTMTVNAALRQAGRGLGTSRPTTGQVGE